MNNRKGRAVPIIAGGQGRSARDLRADAISTAVLLSILGVALLCALALARCAAPGGVSS